MTPARRTLAVLGVAGLVLTLTCGVATASWTAGSVPGGAGAAAATTVDTGHTPTAVSSTGTVTVSWPASTLVSGQAVTGYVVARYDAATQTAETVTNGCAGVLATTTCTESALPDGQWVYTVTPVIGTHWRGAESPQSEPVTTDSTLPANAITVNVVNGNAAQSGTTIFYRGTAPGTLTLTNAVTDTPSGPASSATSALAGDNTGWAHTTSTVSSPAGGPYVSNPFSWDAGTASAPTEAVAGRDVAGNTAVTTVSFVDDSTPPAAGAISYPDGYLADQPVPVTFSAGSDAGSGIATRQLQRSVAPLTDGTCGTFSAFTDLGTDGTTSPYTDSGVAIGSCYTYRYVVTDRLGNQRITSSSSIAKIDPYAGGPALGSAASYSVLAGTGVVNTGPTTISGDLGVSPSQLGTVTGFPPGTVAGTVNAGNDAAATAQSDLSLAYSDAAARTPATEVVGDQGGATYAPGTYHAAAAFAVTGTLTLDGHGDPNALFVIEVDAALNTAASSHIVLDNGAQASHVFWQVNGAVGIGANSTFSGTILAAGAITLGAGTVLIGRALSKGTVTLAGNAIRFTIAGPPTMSIANGAQFETKDITPTLSGTTDAADGRTVVVTVAGQTLTDTVQGGAWSVTAAALTAGDHDVTATVRDAAGNAGSATQGLTVEVNPDLVPLGTASAYSVLAGTGITGTGVTSMSDDLGVSPGTVVTGFPPGTVGGAEHVNDAQAGAAQAARTIAYNDAAGRTPSSEFTGDQAGATYHEGVHHTAAAFALTGTLTLDAQGDPDAVFIIQIDAALNTAASSQVALVNGAQASHVFWQVAGAVNTGASSTIAGTIIATGAVTLGDGTELTGQVLSSGQVVLANDVIAN